MVNHELTYSLIVVIQLKMFKNLSKISFVIAGILFIHLNKCNGIENVQLEFAHDPAYPNTMTVLALQYELISDKVIQVSAQFHINEELTQGTKVRFSKSFLFYTYVNNFLCSIWD